MATEKDFNDILQANRLPEKYVFNEEPLAAQISLPGTLDVLKAFQQAVASLFASNELNASMDNLPAMVLSAPENFGLNNKATQEQVKEALLKELNKDSSLEFVLLPEDISETDKQEIQLFPPENGESVQDYWIWYIRCNQVFPGPVWMMIKRDGTQPAYHYGYM